MDESTQKQINDYIKNVSDKEVKETIERSTELIRQKICTEVGLAIKENRTLITDKYIELVKNNIDIDKILTTEILNHLNRFILSLKTSPDEVIKKILKIINISKKDLHNFHEEIESTNKKFAREILITKNLSQKDVSKLAVRSIEFPEVSFSMTKKRVYPQGIIAGHITGYIGPYSEKDTKTKSFSIFFILTIIKSKK